MPTPGPTLQLTHLCDKEERLEDWTVKLVEGTFKQAIAEPVAIALTYSV
jgi:hypothetical protein